MIRWLSNSALAGLVVAALLTLAALLSLVWTPYGLGAASAPLAEPGAAHWLGTDAQGRDVISVLMTAMLGTLVLVLLGCIASLLLGLSAAVASLHWLGPVPIGRWPAASMLPIALGVGLLFSGLQSPATLTIFMVIAIPGTAFIAVAAQELIVPVWHREFVTSARIAGLSRVSTGQRHVAPALVLPFTGLMLELGATAVLIEAGLSFAGLGVTPPGLSLGSLLGDAQQFLTVRPLLAIMPGLVAVLVALALFIAAGGIGEARRGGR